MSEKTEITLVLDPGVTTGYAVFDELGKCVAWGQIVEVDKLEDFLILATETKNIVRMIYEGYVIRPKGATKHGAKRTSDWSVGERKGHQESCKAVGVIRGIAKAKKIELIEVWPSTLTSGYAHAGMKRASNHKDSHERDAIAHGVNYFVKKGILVPRRISIPRQTKEEDS